MNPSASDCSQPSDTPSIAPDLSCQCDPSGDTTPHLSDAIDPPSSLHERLRRVACDLRQRGSLGTAALLEDCAAELQESVKLGALVLDLHAAVNRQARLLKEMGSYSPHRRRVVLPGEAPSGPVPSGWDEDPQPVTRSEQDLVISQGRAIKLLCDRYGWVRTDWGVLVKHRTHTSVLSLVPEPQAAQSGERELLESSGTIADHAAAAAASVEW